MKFATKPYISTQLTLGLLRQYRSENLLRFDKVKESLKVGIFGTQCILF